MRFLVALLAISISFSAYADPSTPCELDLASVPKMIAQMANQGVPVAKYGALISQLRAHPKRIERIASAFEYSKQEFLGEVDGLRQITMRPHLKGFDEHNQVRYIDGQELAKLRIEVKDGLLFQNGVPFDTRGTSTRFRSGEDLAMFVMDLEGNLYASLEGDMKFQHSSFFAGGPVMGAGEFRVKDGKLIRMTDKSGHYLPTLDLTLQAIRQLLQLGIDLKPVEIDIMAWD